MNQTFYKLQSHPPYARPFGDSEIVVVSDGPLDLGAPEFVHQDASAPVRRIGSLKIP